MHTHIYLELSKTVLSLFYGSVCCWWELACFRQMELHSLTLHQESFSFRIMVDTFKWVLHKQPALKFSPCDFLLHGYFALYLFYFFLLICEKLKINLICESESKGRARTKNLLLLKNSVCYLWILMQESRATA